MKLIEAMKLEKDLRRKADDLVAKIQAHSAIMDYETPVYPDQREQVRQWLQSVHDIFKEIERLRLGIQRTNLATQVTIELGGKQVTKSIAAWIHRRRDLAQAEKRMWQALTDRGLKEGTVKQSNGELKEVKLLRFFDAKQRDEMVELFASEPSAIDGRLEVINATTDLVEA